MKYNVHNNEVMLSSLCLIVRHDVVRCGWDVLFVVNHPHCCWLQAQSRIAARCRKGNDAAFEWQLNQ